MRKENKKRKWGKPKLIVLTRSKPEEASLTNCKHFASGPGMYGPWSENGACYMESTCNAQCNSTWAS